jgi:hypothetical protein
MRRAGQAAVIGAFGFRCHLQSDFLDQAALSQGRGHFYLVSASRGAIGNRRIYFREPRDVLAIFISFAFYRVSMPPGYFTSTVSAWAMPQVSRRMGKFKPARDALLIVAL